MRVVSQLSKVTPPDLQATATSGYQGLQEKEMIHFDGVLDDAALNEFAGMAARRIAVMRNRAKGMSWSVARKASLSIVADEGLKEMIRESIVSGKHPKDAIHEVVKIFERKMK